MLFYELMLLLLMMMHFAQVYYAIEFEAIYIKYILILALVVFATLRDKTFTTDSVYYVQNAEISADWGQVWVDDDGKFNPEFMNRLIPIVLKKTGFYSGPTLVFCIYAILAITLKVLVIFELALYPYLAMMLYVVYVFSYQEMVVMRESVAVGLFFWALKDIYQRRALSYFGKIALAATFHSAALIYTPLYFINSSKINKKMFASGLVAAYLLLLSGGALMKQALPFLDQVDRLQTYVAGRDSTTVINPLSLMEILLLVSACFMIYCYRSQNRQDFRLIVIKIFTLGVILRFICSCFSATLGFRVGDLLLSMLCFALLGYADHLKSRLVGFGIILLIVLFIFLSRAINHQLGLAY